MYPREGGTGSPVLHAIDTVGALVVLRRLFDPNYPAILEADSLPENVRSFTMGKAVTKAEKLAEHGEAILLERYCPISVINDECPDPVVDSHKKRAASAGKSLFVTFLDTEGVPYAISMFPPYITRSTIDAVTGRPYGT
ncbi:MAG: hypothetical protein ABIH90_01375 [Candidatus Aenigmatarchaeota archaeon]